VRGEAILLAVGVSTALASVGVDPARSEAWPEAARDAAAAYADGRFEAATTGYEAAVLAGATRPEIVYNLGAARYRAAEGDSAALVAAAADFERAAARAGASFRPRALYNRANMHALLGDLEAAAEGYRETLRQDPSDADARYNLELVQRLMREQQQNPSPDSESGGDEDREQEEQDADDRQDQQQEDRQEGQPPPEDRTGEEPPQPDQGENEPAPDDESGEGDESPDTAGQPEPETPQQASSISPEEAMRQLDKLEEAERELLRQLLLQRQRRIDVEKDW
jgi:hypothetical protein